MSLANTTFISIIIPVLNDSTRLKLCLEALATQTYPQNSYEIIVVDNGSNDLTYIPEITATFSQVKTAQETTPGSYAARNKAISLIKGELIAFTDADCIPAQNWLENGVKNLLNTPNCGIVAGHVELFFQDSNQLTPVEIYEKVTAFDQKKLVERDRYGATANIFTFKSIFTKVGLFNQTLKSGGDLEWGKRVFAAGYQLLYAPDTLVYHPARSSFPQLYQRTLRLAGGQYNLQISPDHNLLLKQIQFMQMISRDLISLPLALVYHLTLDSRLKSTQEKLIFCYMVFVVRTIDITEKIRLKLGKIPMR